MLDLFKNPPADYRVMPFWFWNAKLDPDEIERQIREMHEKGVGGFFIHGRFGLRTEYMGEDWMRCIERACDTAEKLGMHVYLYDENPFPSGVAGGEAMKNVKHFNKYLDIARQSALPGEITTVQIPEGDLLSAIAVDLDDPSSILDLTEHAEDGRVQWAAPKGRFEVIVFVAAIARSKELIYGSEPDYFDASLVNTFLSFTHERYTARLKRYFGGVIKGIFTDEPKMQAIHHLHDDPFTAPWFADLPEQFRKDHGYDLIPHLACLATDAGPLTGRVRRDYWATLSNAYVHRFFERYRKWCDDNGLQLTGHLFLEEGLYANTMFQGDFAKVLSSFSMPGVDHLALETENEYAIRNVPRSITRTAGQKLASSIAHLSTHSRLLSETYGCCGWTLSLENMKWIFDWQASLGVNFLCPHAFYYSLAGSRKADAPPSEFYQATYWPYYKLFADYAARLCAVLSQGTHRAQVALFYPMKGFQSEWAPGTQGPLDKLIAEYFETYCAYLLKEHVDYDILTEDDIKRAVAVDACLALGGEEYQLLIMPPTTALGYETALKIQEFALDGGKLMGTMLLPTEDADGERHFEVQTIFSELFGKNPPQLRENARSSAFLRKPRLTGVSETAFFFEAESPTDLIRHFRANMNWAIKPEVSVKHAGKECHDITYVHRTVDRDEVFFFSNNALEAREVQISIRCDGAPYMLNLENGVQTALPNCTQRGSRTILLHRFEKCGSLLICFSNEPALAVAPPAQEMGQEHPLPDDWEFSIDGLNSLTLPAWTLNIAEHTHGARYDYQAAFEVAAVPESLFLVLDDVPQLGGKSDVPGSTYTVFVNDAEVSSTGQWLTDINWQSLDISSVVHEGANRVWITVEHGGWSGDTQLMVAPARLMGSFSLDDTGAKLLPPRTAIRSGSWTDQGYPFYSGTANYKQIAKIPEFTRSQRVFIRVDNPADMVEIIVNGASAGVRPWPPFELDITHLVKPGSNTIEVKVTNSLQNMLLSDARPSGLLGGAHLIIY